jgi:hypothetical protein
VTPDVLASLVAAGFGSPAAVAEAGVEKLRTLESVGDGAEGLHAAAVDWVAAHAPAPKTMDDDAEPAPTDDAAAAPQE